MLGTLIKALEVDFRNAENERYLRSATNRRQNLERILAARRLYPEFKAIKPPMFPKLAELSSMSKKEGLCLTYWHDCSEISEFRNALPDKTESVEKTLLAAKPSRFKTASLSRFIERSEDNVLFSYLTDVSKTKGAHKAKRVFNTDSHRQQVTGLLYQLHLLERQLQSMIARHGQQLNFAPQINFAPSNDDTDLFFSNQGAQRDTLNKAGTRDSASAAMQRHNSIAESNGPIDIWYSLAENPQTPYHFLVWLSENENPYVAQRATATLKRQKELQETVPPPLFIPAATLVG